MDAGDIWCPTCGVAAHHSPDPDSERRFVTILRADVVDSTGLVAELDPEEAVSRLEPALAAMRTAVRQFGGIVSKELGDGLVAVFGAPLADDNHAPLACHAAIELVRRVAGMGDVGLQVRVGLHSGHVVAYMIESEYSKVYEIGGAAQHLAARLEMVAEPNQIYASEACQRLAEGHIRFEDLGRKLLKGYAKPLPVYRIVAANDLSSWRVRKARSVARFVGRAKETEILVRDAESASSGREAVLLTGEPGIGKSRLVHEFTQRLTVQGWRLISVECSPNLQGVSFAALKGLLRSSLDSIAANPGHAPDPRTDLPSIQNSALDAVLDRPISDPQWSVMEPHARGRAILNASCAIVENLARHQRTVLLVEDLHWLDRASDAVIAALAALQSPHLLVLFTSRPNGVPNWIERCNAETIALRPLDEEAGRSMLDDILGPSETVFDLKGRIIHHTANIPLFIEELCRSLKDSGLLQGRWGDLALTGPVDELGIPNSVQGVIAARLDRVSKEERALLQIAAALGSRLAKATLRDVAGLPEGVLQRCLALLDRAELLVDVDDEPEGALKFPHDMIRQVTYDSMVDKVRESIHARILLALERSDASHDRTDLLCYHAMRARDWNRAFTYGRAAARKCLSRSAFADAANHFEIAMKALDRLPAARSREADAIDLRIEARVAFMGAGQVAEWFELGKEAERRANTIDDIGRKVAAMTVRAAAQNFYGTPIDAIATGETVVRLAEEWGNVGWLNLARYGLGQAYFIAGRYRQAEQMLGLAYVQLAGPDASAPVGSTPKYLLLLCCMMKSITHTTMGEIDAGDQFHQRALAIADESNRPIDRVAAGYSGGCLLLAQGNPSEAAAVLEEACTIAQKYGLRLFAPIIECHLGIAYFEQGLIDLARDTLAEAREEARSVGYTSTALRTSTYLALALHRLGDTATASEMLRDARNTARQQGFAGLEAEALFAEATVLAASDQADRTLLVPLLQTAVSITSESGTRPLLDKTVALLDRISRPAESEASCRSC